MKKTLPLAFALLIFKCGLSQNVGIGTSTPNKNARLDISDSAKGVLIPRIDSIHRKNIPRTEGLLVYDSTTHSFWYDDGIMWQNMANKQSTSYRSTNSNLEFPDGADNVSPFTLKNLNTLPYNIPQGKNLYIQFFNIPGSSTLFLPGIGMSFANGPVDLGLSIFSGGSIISSSSDETAISGFLADAIVAPVYSNGNYIVPEGKILVVLNSYSSSSFTINSMPFVGNINASKGRLPVIARGGDAVNFGGYFTGYLK